jgi:DNA modification methylase
MIQLHLGDCRDLLKTVSDASVDAVICDPPYPHIKRDYGTLTESEWHELMRAVVAETRRILKPSGSAVFILQPNSRKVGSMRGWLFEFQAWCCREWNMVQDAYWWNTSAIPEAHAIQGRLMRPSVKPCVWLGDPDCWRDQDAVLWDEAENSKIVARCARARNAERHESPGGQGSNLSTFDRSASRRGGVTPFNLIPTTHGQGKSPMVAGSYGHGAGTPRLLIDYWTRYLVPPGGTVCDPFCGSGTSGLVAIKRGLSFIGIDRFPKCYEISRRRIDAELARYPLLTG